ncbi:unnamed protein product [Effrenium voratum]|nr:unnamed protein product [Effrenium voratum]
MGCGASTSIPCRNPLCSLAPNAEGYCCSNCQGLHEGAVFWDVKNPINAKNGTDEMPSHETSPVLQWALSRVHFQGSWRSFERFETEKAEKTESFKSESFLYIALVRNDKELQCRRLCRDPVPAEWSHFDIWLDRDLLLVHDAKPGDRLRLKYQAGKASTLEARAISIALLPVSLASMEHQCPAVTAKQSAKPSRVACKNPDCAYLAEAKGFCCSCCEYLRKTSACWMLNGPGPADEPQSLEALPLREALGTVHLQCWWQSPCPKAAGIDIRLLRAGAEVQCVRLATSPPPSWEHLQICLDRTCSLVRDAMQGDELQLVVDKVEVRGISLTAAPDACAHDPSCARRPAPAP